MIANLTVVNIAVPPIGRELQSPEANLQEVVTA